MRRTLLIFLLFMVSHVIHGQVWLNVGPPDFSIGNTQSTRLVFDPAGTPYVVYQDNALSTFYGNGWATVMKYNGSNWVSVGTPGFSGYEINSPSLAFSSSGVPYVAYAGAPTGPNDARKYNGTAWVTLASLAMPTLLAPMDIAVDAAGTPVVAHADTGSQRASVRRFNGTGWVYIGTPGFSSAGVGVVKLAISNTGTIYVAYGDSTFGHKLTVKKFNGSSWVTVGAPGFTADRCNYINLVLDASGTPYVGYSDNAYGVRTSVMKFNGTSWVQVGSPGFSPNEAFSTSLALDATGTPYVSYSRKLAGGLLGPVNAMKFNGSSWVMVGGADFSPGGVAATSIAIGPDGAPFVAFVDNFHGVPGNVMGPATVMRFDTALGPISGPAAIAKDLPRQ